MKNRVSTTLELFIEARADELRLSQSENYKAWNVERKSWEGGNSVPDYDKEIDKMQSWLQSKTLLLDQEINKF